MCMCEEEEEEVLLPARQAGRQVVKGGEEGADNRCRGPTPPWGGQRTYAAGGETARPTTSGGGARGRSSMARHTCAQDEVRGGGA